MSYVTVEDLPALKMLYKKTVNRGDRMFVFHKADILVSYAKYLIEYLEGIRKNAKAR